MDLSQLVRSFHHSLNMSSDRKVQTARHVKFLKVHEERIKANPSCQNLIMTTTTSTPNTSWPVVPIISDNVITIEDIIRAGPGVVHRDKILLCRSILPSFKINAVSLLVDDPDGKLVLRLALYHFSKSVPAGTILAIMHPWFKFTKDDSASIRCDNPMHVKFIEPTDPILQSVLWKADLPVESGVTKNTAIPIGEENPAQQGNRHFAEKNYSKALECYTKAIEMNPNNPVLFSNRALTYLSLHNPLKALADTETGLALDQSHLKLLYRKAKALLMLKRYREVMQFLEETARRLEKELAGNSEFKKLAQNALIMFIEFNSGRYDFDKIEEEMKQCKFLEYHAEFEASSMFEIKEIPGKGRGLVATRDIPYGTHLMVCKAFAFAPASDTEAILVRYDTNKFEALGVTTMIQQICDKLMSNPELGREFYQLDAGPALGVLRIYDPSNPVDIDRILAIVQLNSFAQFRGNRSDYDLTKSDSGVWLLPSYLNHSCGDANCKRMIFGDFMFIGAKKFIKRGEELLIKYFQGKKSYEERTSSLARTWFFKCDCSLCIADRRRLGRE